MARAARYIAPVDSWPYEHRQGRAARCIAPVDKLLVCGMTRPCRSSMGLLWHRQEGDDVKVKLSGIVPLLLLVWLRPLPGTASSSKSLLPLRIAHKGRAAR